MLKFYCEWLQSVAMQLLNCSELFLFDLVLRVVAECGFAVAKLF